jgi:hypothetical protein
VLEELEPIDGADSLLEPLNMQAAGADKNNGSQKQLDAQERGGD